MERSDITDALRKSGAYLEGHFALTSGLHSDKYFEKFRVLENPKLTEALCAQLARRFKDDGVEIVVGPATGGILLAYEVAKTLGTLGIFAERESGRMRLRRGFTIRPGQRTLVVEDVVTTGGSVREVLELVRESGGDLVGIGLLVDRSGGEASFGARTEALAHLEMAAWEPNLCPMCEEGVPLTERGSRHLG